jgi:hypothetical protein
MKVTVFHNKRCEITHEVIGLKKMAVVDCGDREVDDALEYAWERTNNIYGSWSRGRYVEGEINNDYSEDVKVIAPLEKGWDGKEYGHRSSMVGDCFLTDPTSDGIGEFEDFKTYRVAPCGFEEITDKEFVDARIAYSNRNRKLYP